MKRLSILSTTVGIVIGFLIATIVDYKYDLSQAEKPTFEHPYVYWNDHIHRPEHGFEKTVDIYENEVGDTIFMELSYGYEND